MDKAALKAFATEARRQLLDQVTIQAQRLGLTADHPVFYTPQGDYLTLGTRQYPASWRATFESLNEAWQRQGFSGLVDEVAYTWFNRLVAIRYMEVHDYLPSHVRVLSSVVAGQVDPDILLHYRDLDWPLEFEALDRAIAAGQRDGVFRRLLIEQCNQLHAIMPFLFEKIQDYTELLLPDYLLHTDSVVRRLVTDIAEEDFDDVEIIGWLYQYYIAEKNKQIVGMNKGTVAKEDLPAATQLFTPRWIVQYMVENSLGRLWKAAHPGSSLDTSWAFYLFRGEGLPSTALDVEHIKILDPACGSGHILVYAFEMLYTMYEELGYVGSSIPEKILTNNLYGLDIDRRATQLAMLALVMKARERDRKFFQRNIIPQVIAFEDADEVSEDGLRVMCQTPEEGRAIRGLLTFHQNARQFGSLLTGYPIEADHFIDRINALDSDYGDMGQRASVAWLKSRLVPILRQNQMLLDVYDVVITNPPYHNKYNPVLKDFLFKQYRNYKGDLYSAFIYRCSHWARPDGYTAMMSPFTWMFISSHEKLRLAVLEHFSISSLVQLEYSGFDEATVPICTFVLHRQTDNRMGIYLRLEDFKGPANQPVKVQEAVNNPAVPYRYVTRSDQFSSIPGSPIAYWASEAIRRAFREGRPLDAIAKPRQGLATADNDRFLRLWHEVELNRIGFGYASAKEALRSQRKWFPYNKGGAYRKWYGNQDYVVNWANDGQELHDFPAAVIRNPNYYFLPGITWTDVSSSKFGVRYTPSGFLFDVSGSSIFPEHNTNYILSFMTSHLSIAFLKVLNPTLHFQVGNIAALPLIIDEHIRPEVDHLAQENIAMAQEDWDDFETSWNFTQHPLVKFRTSLGTLASAFAAWEQHAAQRFRRMQAQETALNRLFIHLYGLDQELTSDVPNAEITLRQADDRREAQSFLSYFIGCVMGRYSLDVPGLAYAGGQWDARRFQTFEPVSDGIVVLTDNPYFAHDVINRLEEFLATTYGSQTVPDNLRWLADRVDRRPEDAPVTRIRRYLLQGFFKDHCAVYKKRPLYWLFDAGPKQGFRALVYLHRWGPETLARLRLEYLQPLQIKVAEEIRQLETRLTSQGLSRTERRIVEARRDVLRSRQQECVRYDQILADLANQRIGWDLDDGVPVNYAKFEAALAPIK